MGAIPCGCNSTSTILISIPYQNYNQFHCQAHTLEAYHNYNLRSTISHLEIEKYIKQEIICEFFITRSFCVEFEAKLNNIAM